jgi:hypothetical protein
MTTSKERITVSLDPAVVAAARAAVAGGQADSVSAYVEATLVERAARDAWLTRWRALTGGPPSPELRDWALGKLGVSTEIAGARQAS